MNPWNAKKNDIIIYYKGNKLHTAIDHRLYSQRLLGFSLFRSM